MTEKIFKVNSFNLPKLNYLKISLEIKDKENFLIVYKDYMIRLVKYFFQSILIYIFFFIGRILGLKISRILFANIFAFLGPTFKSKKIIEKI